MDTFSNAEYKHTSGVVVNIAKWIASVTALCIYVVLPGCGTIVSGAMVGVVALGESQRTPEKVQAEKLAEIKRIQEAANNGDHYARIELASKCYETSFPCVVTKPEETFKHYADLGYDIAIYYYASYRLGLTPLGYQIQECQTSKADINVCIDRKVAAELLTKLASKGCDYEVQAYKREEKIYPCARLKRVQ
jgi:hypothetical protein